MNCVEFSTNKLLILFSIAWLLQLKKIPNNKLKINENIQLEDGKTGVVSLSKGRTFTK